MAFVFVARARCEMQRREVGTILKSRTEEGSEWGKTLGRTSFVTVTKHDETRSDACTVSRVPNPELLQIGLAEVHQLLDPDELGEAFFKRRKSSLLC